MGYYTRGNVVIAPVAFQENGIAKTRPAVVIGTTEQGDVYLCPVSSKPSSDDSCVPISLDDFSEGGLDLFTESYVLTAQVRRIRSGEVIGKRGQLTGEIMAAISTRIQQSVMSGASHKKGP